MDKFKVGDIIVRTSNDTSMMPIGRICRVRQALGEMDIRVDDDSEYRDPNYYRIATTEEALAYHSGVRQISDIPKLKGESKKVEFKIGDIIVRIDKYNTGDMKTGNIYCIKSVTINSHLVMYNDPGTGRGWDSEKFRFATLNEVEWYNQGGKNISEILAEITGDPKDVKSYYSFNNKNQTENVGHTINITPITPIIKGGQRPKGNIITGKIGRATIKVGYLSNRAVFG